MAEGKRCPECLSAIYKEAAVCKFCGERIEGIRCLNCASICKPEAKVCKWCGKVLPKSGGFKLTKEIEIKATFWGSLLSRGSFHPQRAVFTKDKIIMSTYGFLALTRNDEEILWEKVAGFQHKNGIIWDTIWIETRGQTMASIWGLRRSDAIRIKAIFQKLEK